MRFSNELKVGIAVVVCTAIFILGSRYFLSLPTFSGTQSFHTSFEEAGGLISGNAVHINGVLLGAIRKVHLMDNGEVQVDFTISKSVALTHGSRATIGGLAVLGITRLDIIPGPPDTTRYESGDWIPGSLDNDLNTLTESVPQLIQHTDSLIVGTNRAISVVHELMGNPQSDLRTTLLAIQDAASSASTLLKAEQETISSTLKGIEELSGSLTTLTRDSLGVTVTQLNALLLHMDEYLTALEQTTANLDMVLQKINDGEGTLGKLINDDSLYTELDTALSRINEILEDFERNPGKYLKELRLVDIL